MEEVEIALWTICVTVEWYSAQDAVVWILNVLPNINMVKV